MISFKTIRARAEKRKGGPKALAKLLPDKPDAKALAKLPDDRILAEMTKRVFCAGFAWSVVEQKWPDFEKAFLGFKPAKLAFQPDEYWHALLEDKRIVRNGAKIMSVRENAPIRTGDCEGTRQLRQVPEQVAGIRRDRPAQSAHETRQPARRQYRADAPALRRLGRLCHLKGRRGVPARCRHRHRRRSEIEGRPRQGPGGVQRLGRETKLPYAHLSRICALSVGENYQP